MQLRCPKCNEELGEADINVASNIAFCRRCGEAYRLSELVGGSVKPKVDPTISPPRGCWYRETAGGWEAGASTRSFMALFFVPFTIAWSGGSLGGIYGSQIVRHKFDLMLSLFGLPFLVGTIVLIGLILMSVAGSVVLSSTDGETLVVWLGAGGIGWRRRVKIAAGSRIGQGAWGYRNWGGGFSCIAIEGLQSIRFGSNLRYARQVFLLQTLRLKFPSLAVAER